MRAVYPQRCDGRQVNRVKFPQTMDLLGRRQPQQGWNSVVQRSAPCRSGDSVCQSHYYEHASGARCRVDALYRLVSPSGTGSLTARRPGRSTQDRTAVIIHREGGTDDRSITARERRLGAPGRGRAGELASRIGNTGEDTIYRYVQHRHANQSRRARRVRPRP